MSDNIKSEIQELRETHKIAYLASINEEGKDNNDFC